MGAVGSLFNGIREQAYHQARALRSAGHTVELLNPWEKYDLDSFDLVQFFQGGPGLHTIETKLQAMGCVSVFAPIIDSMTPHWQYRIAKILGSMHSKFDSVPSYFSKQANGSTGIVARSEYERSKLIRGLGVDASKIRVVLNGCSYSGSVNPELAIEKYNLTDDFVLHVSRFTNPTKNALNMIKAIGPSGRRLIIVGTSEQSSAYYRDIVKETEKYSNITIVGRVEDDIRDSLYAACRVFCLPSHHEGTGLVAVEAASHGANIVITDQGGPPDYFLQYADYVSSAEVPAIAEAMDKAWSREKDGKLQQHVINNLSWSASAISLISAYKDFKQLQTT